MARYITLINFTEQGIKTIKDWDKRVAATRERMERSGGKLIDVYLTFGEFDAIAPNDTPAGRAKNRRIEITLQPNIDELVAVPETK